MGLLLCDSFDMLNELLEDIGSMNWVRGGAEEIVSCHCWW